MTKRDNKPCKQCGSSEWYASGTCKPCQRRHTKIYQEENKDKARVRNRRWYEKNKNTQSARAIQWQKENPDKVREKGRRWRKNNPGKVRTNNHIRRARETKAGGSFTVYEWDQIVKHQDARCLACGKKKKLTADHIIPVSKGGTSNIDNIQGLCTPCNSSKGARTIDYRKKKGIVRWIQDKLF